jgi:hypothetical protein|mmetsp:Transcript_19120/g.30479  ORF Transcript_19120/g.30479 Transcript_19120/m.30479 type:complete len:134 (-) Transcript_19120:702-1103(-)
MKPGPEYELRQTEQTTLVSEAWTQHMAEATTGLHPKGSGVQFMVMLIGTSRTPLVNPAVQGDMKQGEFDLWQKRSVNSKDQWQWRSSWAATSYSPRMGGQQLPNLLSTHPGAIETKRRQVTCVCNMPKNAHHQ